MEQPENKENIEKPEENKPTETKPEEAPKVEEKHEDKVEEKKPEDEPKQVTSLSNIKDIAVGYYHAVAVDEMEKYIHGE